MPNNTINNTLVDAFVQQSVVQVNSIVSPTAAIDVVIKAEIIGNQTTVQSVGIPGPTGPPGKDGSGGITIEYQWNVVNPFPLTPILVGTWIETIEVFVIEPFNGTGAALSVGDTTNPAVLFPSNLIDPTTAGVYSINPGIFYDNAANLVLGITAGIGTNQGSGIVVLYIS